MKKKSTAILSTIAALFATSEAHAADATAGASATVMAPISVSNTAELRFGKFSAPTGGTVAISPAGARSATGAVVISSTDEGGAAAFSIDGAGNATFAITLPDSTTLTHSTDETKTMSIGSYASNPSGAGVLSADGSQTLAVGATLTVGENQSVGTYSGTFDVAVEYN